MKKVKEAEGMFTVRAGPLLGALDAVCEARGESRSDFVRRAVEDAVRAHPGFRLRLLYQILQIFRALTNSPGVREILGRDGATDLKKAIVQARDNVGERLHSEGRLPGSKVEPFVSKMEEEQRRDVLVWKETDGLWNLLRLFD
jgi:hypothetical protein